MPDTFQESTYNGFPVAKIYTGEYKGESQFVMLGVKKAQAILDNIDRLRMWVDKQEKPTYKRNYNPEYRQVKYPWAQMKEVRDR